MCSTAVYVTTDGTWKLGGLEYLCLYVNGFQFELQKLFHINMLLNMFKAVSIWEKHDYEAQYEIKRR